MKKSEISQAASEIRCGSIKQNGAIPDGKSDLTRSSSLEIVSSLLYKGRIKKLTNFTNFLINTKFGLNLVWNKEIYTKIWIPLDAFVVVTNPLGVGKCTTGPKDPAVKEIDRHNPAQPTIVSRDYSLFT